VFVGVVAAECHANATLGRLGNTKHTGHTKTQKQTMRGKMDRYMESGRLLDSKSQPKKVAASLPRFRLVGATPAVARPSEAAKTRRAGADITAGMEKAV
jgi:hypothetical protein